MQNDHSIIAPNRTVLKDEFMISLSYSRTYRHITRISRLFPACFVVFLCSCAPIPPKGSSPEMKPVEQYETGQSFAGPERNWPDEKWWTAYHDPQLDKLIEEALVQAPSMTIAEARFKQAVAIAKQVGAVLQPQVSMDASATVQKLSYNYNLPPDLTPRGTHGYGSMALNFNWELDFWGKNRAALQAATSAREAAAADAAQARLLLSASIASEYGELARLYDTLDTVNAIAGIQKKNLELFMERNRHGLENLASVERAKSLLARTEEEALALEKQIGLQRNKLAALMGAGPDRGLSITRPQLHLTATYALPAELPMNLLGRRPDIVAARLQVEAATSMIEKQKAEFYPNVNLSAFLGYQALGLDKVLKSGSDFGGIGPAISLPIFTGGRLSAELEEVRAGRDEAVGIYNQTVSVALQEVGDAILNQKQLILQLEKIRTAVTSAREAHRIISDRYRGGLANYLEVLAAEETWLETSRTEKDLQSRIFTYDVALIKALGGGYNMPTSADTGHAVTEN